MKRFTYFLALLSCIFNGITFAAESNSQQERHIVIVIASYNNKRWHLWNLDSVLNQKYTNYHVIYIDDCSKDGTGDLVAAYIKEHNAQDRITLIRNEVRAYSLANRYHAIHSCDDRSVIIILDGDDALKHDGVLAYVNQVYADPDVWLTYGQFCEYPSGNIGFCKETPDWVVHDNAFRKYSPTPSHLRTFYAGLFKKIRKQDLMYEGQFFSMTDDMAMMLPMIEMARLGHFRFIPEVLYVYNTSNPLNDHKVAKELQQKIDKMIRERPPYAPLARLF